MNHSRLIPLIGLVFSWTLVLIHAHTGVAYAHGPCGDMCLEPNSGPPGTAVTTENLEGVLAVWNPRPNTLPLGVPGTSARCDPKCARAKPLFHLEQPTRILAESVKPTQLHFAIPESPTGKYLIVVYDGSEGGFHYTWETFEVTEGDQQQDSEATSEPENEQWPVYLVIGVALLGGSAAGWLLSRLRTN